MDGQDVRWILQLVQLFDMMISAISAKFKEGAETCLLT